MTSRLIIGISGASGAIYGITALRALHGRADIETHLVISAAGARTIVEETDYTIADVKALAGQAYSFSDIGASLASGSFLTMGMLVAPCSIRSLSAIGHALSDNLLTRAADVCLKERRTLVLMVRETPLHAGHIEAMAAATRAGAIIAPPVPAFYAKPKTIEDIVDHAVGRALDAFGIEHDLVKRWGDTPKPGAERVVGSSTD